jgi:hypothetical protein
MHRFLSTFLSEKKKDLLLIEVSRALLMGKRSKNEKERPGMAARASHHPLSSSSRIYTCELPVLCLVPSLLS